MKKGTSFEQAYNAQATVDSAHQVIVAQALTNQPLRTPSTCRCCWIGWPPTSKKCPES
ncbi:hypothetical protein [Myxococcus xanthus]|uniref:hypothetical protein n=1 Tax=Myxococcus xanthus TaxID=34 RepID=UPI0013758464|nr:hypothetical protein [Myxococcus xanthus]